MGAPRRASGTSDEKPSGWWSDKKRGGATQGAAGRGGRRADTAMACCTGVFPMRPYSPGQPGGPIRVPLASLRPHGGATVTPPGARQTQGVCPILTDDRKEKDAEVCGIARPRGRAGPAPPAGRWADARRSRSEARSGLPLPTGDAGAGTHAHNPRGVAGPVTESFASYASGSSERSSHATLSVKAPAGGAILRHNRGPGIAWRGAVCVGRGMANEMAGQAKSRSHHSGDRLGSEGGRACEEATGPRRGAAGLACAATQPRRRRA